VEHWLVTVVRSETTLSQCGCVTEWTKCGSQWL